MEGPTPLAHAPSGCTPFKDSSAAVHRPLQTWQKLQVSTHEKTLSLPVVLREERGRGGGKERKGGKRGEGKGKGVGKRKRRKEKYRKEGGRKKGWERKERDVHLFRNVPHTHTHQNEVMLVGPSLCRHTLPPADAH